MLLLALSCGDPELEPVADALGAWDRARVALEAGDRDAALRGVREARALDPRSPALAGWEAEVLRQQGDVAAAKTLLDAALLATPDHAELRQQRAWLRMSSGDALGAAEDLAPLVRAGLVDPETLAGDPVYASLADDPTTAWLVPPPRVVAEISTEAGAVLVGETWVLDIVVDVRVGARVEVRRAGPPSGAPLRLERVVDDRLESDGRRERRRITWTFRATGPATTALGPWTVSTGRATTTVGPVPVEVAALGARQSSGVSWVPESLPVPLSLAGEDAELAPLTSAGRSVLPAPPGADVTLEGAPEPGVVHAEARAAGQPRWQGPVLPAGTRARAVVRSGARTLFEGTLP
jgi:hypothetical protein